jgi:DedD protein
MRLPFLRPKTETASPLLPPRGKVRPVPTRVDDPTEVEAARTQARRRLVGALVLLVIGVLGFPVLFETQPRPLPIDTPMEVAHREAVASGSVAAETAVAAVPRERSSPLPPDAGTEAPPPASAPFLAKPMAASAAASTAAKAAVTTAAPAALPAPVAVPRPSPAQPPPAPLAKGPPAASAAAPAEMAASAARWVVQAGAYGEAGKLREARAKIEQIGLKTYTQVIDSDKGSRTRVRVGPYATKAEAEATAAKIKKTGLPAAIIAL